MPAISVILPIYNMEDYIEESINSILHQTFSDFELLCVDDGSTDNTANLLKDIAKRDSRISIITQENLGPGVARNTGLDRASGEYVIMLDSDDIYSDQMLEKLYSEALTTNADVTICRSCEFDNSTGKKEDTWWTVNISQLPNKRIFTCNDMPDFIFTAFVGWPWDKLYRREFIEENKIRFPRLSNSEDLYFVFLSLVLAKGISIVDEVLVQHRVNRSNSVSGSRSKHPLQFYESTCLLKKALQKDSELYARLSWGFLNWTFTYMLWNIETMDDEVARKKQLDALKNDSFVELEIGQHSPSYYSLEPSSYGRYISLLREAEGMAEIKKKKDGTLIPIMIRMLERLQSWGFARTVQFIFRWFSRRLLHKSGKTKSPKLIRGNDFSITGENAVERLSALEDGE